MVKINKQHQISQISKRLNISTCEIGCRSLFASTGHTLCDLYGTAVDMYGFWTWPWASLGPHFWCRLQGRQFRSIDCFTLKQNILLPITVHKDQSYYLLQFGESLNIFIKKMRIFYGILLRIIDISIQNTAIHSNKQL